MEYTYFKSFYARKEKEFTYNFTLFNIPTLFIGSLNQNVLCQKKKQISLWSFFSQIWRLLLDNNYLLTLYNNIATDLVLFNIVDELKNIKEHQDQKIL